MRATARLVVLVLFVGWTTSACRNGRSAAGSGGALGAAGTTGPIVVLHAGDHAVPFRVEVARTGPEHNRGLMYRNHLDPDAGMLFIFEHDGPMTFWMKNTFIPLDMIFISHDRRIVGIVENATPETETPRRVEGNSRYVLEIGGGLSRRFGVLAGSTVDFQGLPLDGSSP
ncbi:MAG: DUF192 domain-containing protein [Pseudomonadota bacterium]